MMIPAGSQMRAAPSIGMSETIVVITPQITGEGTPVIQRTKDIKIPWMMAIIKEPLRVALETEIKLSKSLLS